MHNNPMVANSCGERITEQTMDGRGSVQAIARCADALEVHDVDRAQPLQKDDSDVSSGKRTVFRHSKLSC